MFGGNIARRREASLALQDFIRAHQPRLREINVAIASNRQQIGHLTEEANKIPGAYAKAKADADRMGQLIASNEADRRAVLGLALR